MIISCLIFSIKGKCFVEDQIVLCYDEMKKTANLYSIYYERENGRGGCFVMTWDEEYDQILGSRCHSIAGCGHL